MSSALLLKSTTVTELFTTTCRPSTDVEDGFSTMHRSTALYIRVMETIS